MAGSMGARKPTTKTKKTTKPKETVDPDKKYLCPYCNKEKRKDEFYVSSDPLVLTGITSMCKDCARKIARNYNETTGEYGDCTKSSIQAALERLDKPWLEDVYEASYNEFNSESPNEKHPTLWATYIKNITSLKQYKGMRWRDGDIFATQQVQTKIQENKEEAYETLTPQEEKVKIPKDQEIYSEYMKNKSSVIRLLGYDPFSSEAEADKPLLYSQLVGYLDMGGDNEDMMRTSSAITIVRGFLQQAKIDDMLANSMKNLGQDGKAGEIKSLLDSKQKVSSTISQLAEQSCLSLKHNKNASKGENTITGMMKKLKDINLREAEVNAFDIGTAEGMRQVADISNASIMKQIRLDENDYTEMLGQQREMIVKLQEQSDKNEEAARLLLRENLDLKKYMEEKGIDISEYCSENKIISESLGEE